MRFKKAPLILLLILPALGACVSGSIRIESQPEKADVLLSVNGQPARKIGETPYMASESSIGAGKDPFQIILEKEGFYSQNVVVPPTVFSRQTVIQVKMKEAASARSEANTENLQKVAAAVSGIQVLMRAKQYEEAQHRLSLLIAQYPGVATFYELLGNSQYLSKDLSKALVSYRRASELNPGNPDTKRMIEKIEAIRGPSGGAL